MEITGKLTQITNAQEGVSQKGPWRKATGVFVTEGEYPKTVAVDFWNSKLDEATKIPLGTTCKVRFDVESREFNGKWYTNCKCFGIEAVGATQPATQPAPQPQQAYNPPQQQPSWDAPIEPLGENDDLPF